MADPLRADKLDEESQSGGKKAVGGFGNSFKAYRAVGPLFGSGIQLAAAVALFFFLGRWLDGTLGTGPWLMLIGALIGAGGGLYNFIRTAIKAGEVENTISRETEGNEEH